MVLANLPFGKKSSTVIVGEFGCTCTEKDIVERGDVWATTSNKQLNFVQYLQKLLATDGRVAVVLPDNALFCEWTPTGESPWTKRLWIYDLRTSKDFMLKTNPLRREDLEDFVALHNAANRNQREATWSAGRNQFADGVCAVTACAANARKSGL